MPNQSTDQVRDLFAAPTNAYRPLAIIHQFHTKRQTTWESGLDVTGSTATPDYRSDIRAYLSKLADWGFGGVVANVGAENYLEDEEQWRVFLSGASAARDLGMRLWIYDEHGYPSGAAGGIVLRDHPEYEAQGLVRSQQEFEPGAILARPPSGWLYAVRAEIHPAGSDEVVDVTSHITEDGTLRLALPTSCRIVRYDARRAFEGTHATRNVFRLRRYINVLQQEAVDYFFKVTAEQYLKRLGDDARAVEAVFTDEPSFMSAYFPELPVSFRGKIPAQDEPQAQFDRLPMITWEKSLPEKFWERWGYDLVPELGRLFENDTPRDLRVRHDFHQLISEIYAKVYFGSQQARLAQVGIEFSGHVLAEEPIVHHVACEGNVMADLKEMGFPGIDMLNSVGEEILDTSRLLTCKYGSSSAHAAGRKQVMTEASDFEQQVEGRRTSLVERRGAVAVQMALGVTTITSYYAWHDVDPEERRQVLDFWARLSTVLRHGTHVADVAVLYPIRTAWAVYRPVGEVLVTGLMDEPLRSMDAHVHAIARGILAEGLDFDFIDTRDLINAQASGGRLRVGDEDFSVLVIPPGAVMCPKDLESLERFVRAGGHILAFQPASDVALPEIDSPPTGRDLGKGRSPAQVLTSLAESAPGRVVRSTLDVNWTEFFSSAVTRELGLRLRGTHMIARRSVHENTDFVLLANGSREEASARVEFGPGRELEIWDPWTGAVERVSSNTANVTVPVYSAMVVVSERNSG